MANTLGEKISMLSCWCWRATMGLSSLQSSCTLWTLKAVKISELSEELICMTSAGREVRMPILGHKNVQRKYCCSQAKTLAIPLLAIFRVFSWTEGLHGVLLGVRKYYDPWDYTLLSKSITKYRNFMAVNLPHKAVSPTFRKLDTLKIQAVHLTNSN